MLRTRFSGSFKRDRKRAERRGKDVTVLDSVIRLLAAEQCLDSRFQDHKLKGEYVGCRECHLEYDWVLIYRIVGDEIIFTRTGTHSDLLD